MPTASGQRLSDGARRGRARCDHLASQVRTSPCTARSVPRRKGADCVGKVWVVQCRECGAHEQIEAATSVAVICAEVLTFTAAHKDHQRSRLTSPSTPYADDALP